VISIENNIEIVRISSGGKVTVPRAIRETLKLREGDYLGVHLEKNRIIYYPVEIKPTKSET
jgi:AbrB family looped-hinge helix DNA binding protein